MNWYDNFQIALLIALVPVSLSAAIGPQLGQLFHRYRRVSLFLDYGGITACVVLYVLCFMCAVYNTYFMK